MQTLGGAEAEAAISSSECRMVAQILVDWDKNGTFNHRLSDITEWADNINLNKSLAGAAPAEIMLVEGSSSAELTFDMGGNLLPVDGQISWVSALSPYNGLSPFYNKDVLGCEIKYSIGVETVIGIVWYPQFIGNLRTLSPDRGSNGVQITALDRAEKLRRPLTWTDWGMMDLQAGDNQMYGQIMYGEWVIDHCLKNCDTSSSPYTWGPDEATAFGSPQIFLSGAGGIAPNVGWVDGSWQNAFAPDSDPSLKVYHPYGQVHPSSPEPGTKPQMFKAHKTAGYDQNLYWANDRDAVNVARSHIIGFTLHTDTLAGSDWVYTMPEDVIIEWHPTEYRTMQVVMAAGQVWLRLIQTSGTISGTFNTTHLTIPAGPYVRIRAEYEIFGPIRLSIVGGPSTGLQNTGFTNIGWSFHEQTGLAKIFRSVSLQDIAIGTHTLGLSGVPVPGEAGVASKYAAVLDPSLNRFSFLPNRRGNLAWDVITEVAAAEFGAAFWDETGVFHFWNQDTILGKRSTVVRNLSLDDVSGLRITSSKDSVRNFLSITARKARAQNVTTWESQGPDEYIGKQLGLVDNLTTLWLQDVITPGSARPPIYAHPDQTGSAPADAYPHWSDQIKHGVVLQINDPGIGWKNNSWTGALLSMGLWMYRGPSGECILRYNEGYVNPVRFAVSETWDNLPIPEGTSSPAMRWDGSKLNFFDDLVFNMKNEASITKWGVQGLELSSDWYQEFFNYASLMDKLLVRTANPIPATDNVVIAGDPRLQLGDVVSVWDPDGLGEELRLQILGINRTFSKSDGLIDELTVELVRPANIGIWDSSQYGLWDTTFYWSA